MSSKNKTLVALDGQIVGIQVDRKRMKSIFDSISGMIYAHNLGREMTHYPSIAL